MSFALDFLLAQFDCNEQRRFSLHKEKKVKIVNFSCVFKQKLICNELQLGELYFYFLINNPLIVNIAINIFYIVFIYLFFNYIKIGLLKVFSGEK